MISVLWERVGDYLVEVGSDLTQLRQLEDQLVDQRSLVFATERDKALLADRERIARNLHDTVIQQIYASSLALNAVATRLNDFIEESGDTHDRVKYVVKTIADDLSTLISTIRDEIFAVRHESKASLQRELEEVILPIIGPSAMDLELHVLLEQIQDVDILNHLRAVVREAVSNAVRHSRGMSVQVAVHKSPEGCLHVVVSDDGMGISPDTSRSSGLTNIEERARALGGSVEISSIESQGTTVSWRVPVPGWES